MTDAKKKKKKKSGFVYISRITQILTCQAVQSVNHSALRAVEDSATLKLTCGGSVVLQMTEDAAGSESREVTGIVELLPRGELWSHRCRDAEMHK